MILLGFIKNLFCAVQLFVEGTIFTILLRIVEAFPSPSGWVIELAGELLKNGPGIW